MKKRIFASLCAIALFASLLTAFSVIDVLHYQTAAELTREVRSEGYFIAEALNHTADNAAYLASIAHVGKSRITLISADGSVLFDNFAAAEKMQNHAARPEVQAALKNGFGEAERRSDTLGKSTYYYALALTDGSVLRMASTRNNLWGSLGGAAIFVALALLCVLLVAVLASRRITAGIIRPVNHLDLDNPLGNETYEELAPLLTRMDKQNAKIAAGVQELLDKNREIATITDNIADGILIFSPAGRLLSANQAAKRIFPCRENDSYPDFCRDKQYLALVSAALQGESRAENVAYGARIYSLSANAVGGAGGKSGVFLFLRDITELQNSEKLRREFSANVSHELKTPLTSILGYAEIIENGIAKAEDIPLFSEKIHSEAARLLALIEDIIKLSQLDEQQLCAQFAPVELSLVCAEVAESLREKAQKRAVSLEIDCEKVSVPACLPLLRDMLYNLCDNAIIYNHAGGFVRLTLKNAPQAALLTVADSGIGISNADCERVFERFYRVDKSHSKETGGTGLGLSIVKHGAALHRAALSLESREGEGSRFSLSFPKCGSSDSMGE